MLADQPDYVVGIDSHRDRHALVLVRGRDGARLLEAAVAADAAGYRQALALAGRHAAGARVWAIEGSGCYGKGLARFLESSGERVLELVTET